LEADATRGVRYQDAAGKEVGIYQNSYALVVGASAYAKGWPKLPGVVDDINQVSKALKIHGFEVTVVRDPDHRQLRNAFNDFINNYGQAIDNRLLFYFAGHGYTKRLSYGAEMGYIVPVDAPNPDLDMSGFLAKALDMQQFEVYARRIESKHALFLFDSCFSGSIFALERAIPGHISYKTARPVRQFITSGSVDETVPDTSIFRHQFLAALDGEGDVNQDGYITASELGEFLFEKVVLYSDDTQHPQYGKIRDMYLDKGDFVFLLRRKGQPKSRLYVDTVPEDARIRVLNIKQEFFQGMELEPGSYHIEVSAAGYETEKRWIDFVAGREEPFKFGLKKIIAAEPLSPQKTPVTTISVSDEPPAPQKTITNSIGMKFAPIPAGTFMMGSHSDEPGRNDNEKQHEVKISKPFYLQTTEVTQGQWKNVMGENSSLIDDCGDKCPVEGVPWVDAQEFIKKLNQKESTNKYRLPTEAEWEYACRAGTTTPFYTGKCISTDQANYDGHNPGEDCPKGKYRGKKIEVGSFQANAWGLYDMHGNVLEWCQDWYGNYPSSQITDPRGLAEGDLRVVRGGSWYVVAQGCRSANRGGRLPEDPNDFVGFRLAKSVSISP
jgi:formylglycine-generating enzyme required for sulfatase activity